MGLEFGAGTTALVTGGAGFIGSHLVEALLAHGVRVRVFDNLSTGSLDNLSGSRSAIEFLEGDLRDLAACRHGCQDVDRVFHLAALGSVPRSVRDPHTSNAVNVGGTLNLLTAARDAGVRRFIFSSSSSVYGENPAPVKSEELSPLPLSPYAVSKLAGENYCRAFRACYGLETVVLRYFNVFGPRQNPNSTYAAVIPRFIAALQAGRPPIIYGDGLQSRDFTFVANVVQGNLLAAHAPDGAGEVFNIACGGTVTLREVLIALQDLLQVEVAPEFHPAQPGDLRKSHADIRKAASRLGYHPAVTFAEGLARTVESYLRPHALSLASE